MTVFKNRKKTKAKIKSVVSTILIFLFAIVSSAVLVVEKRKYKAFDERILYFVSVGSAKTSNLLESKKELLKNLGGANVVYSYKGISHLIANVYLDQESALEIKENLQEHFPDVDILKIRLKRVSNKGIRAVKDIVGAEKFIKKIFELSNEYQNLQMSYLIGDLSEGEFMSRLVDEKINLEKIMENIDKTTELAQKIMGYGELIDMQLTSILNGLTIAKHKQNYVCNYFVGFYMIYAELFECL